MGNNSVSSNRRIQMVTHHEIGKIDVNTIREDKPDGCIIEDDLEHPKKLHNLHNGYQLAPKKIKIKENVLSNYCIIKLVPSLCNKNKSIEY